MSFICNYTIYIANICISFLFNNSIITKIINLHMHNIIKICNCKSRRVDINLFFNIDGTIKGHNIFFQAILCIKDNEFLVFIFF